jgi:hypothetical protein
VPPPSQGDLDPDDTGADYNTSNDVFHVDAKAKQGPGRSSGSLLSMRGLSKPPGGNQPSVSSPLREEDSSLQTDVVGSTAPSDDDSDEEEIRLLDDLLKTANDQNDDAAASPLPSRQESTASLSAVDGATAAAKEKKDNDAMSVMSEPPPGSAPAGTTPSSEANDSSKGEGKQSDSRQSVMSNPLHPLSAIWGSMRSRSDGPSSPSQPIPTASPHIKLTFRHNTKKFSVTVWHAARFEALRRSCGLGEDT